MSAATYVIIKQTRFLDTYAASQIVNTIVVSTSPQLHQCIIGFVPLPDIELQLIICEIWCCMNCCAHQRTTRTIVQESTCGKLR